MLTFYISLHLCSSIIDTGFMYVQVKKVLCAPPYQDYLLSPILFLAYLSLTPELLLMTISDAVFV